MSFVNPPETDVPEGYRYDPFYPDRVLTRCPECGDTEIRVNRPDAPSKCVGCNRLRGVTPLRKVSGAGRATA